MRFFAIDLGNTTGFAWEDTKLGGFHSGVWKLKHWKDTAPGQRLRRLSNCLNDIHTEKGIDRIICETWSGTGPHGMLENLFAMRGVVEMVAFDLVIPVSFVLPQQFKKVIVGSGHASKQATIDEVSRRIGSSITNHNEADAVAMLLWAKERLVSCQENGERSILSPLKRRRRTNRRMRRVRY